VFALRIDPGKHHQNVCSDLIVLGEVLEAVLLGYSIGLGLEPRVSLIKFSDHCHLLLRRDETLNLPLGEPDLFHPRHTPRPLRACRERPRDRRAADAGFFLTKMRTGGAPSVEDRSVRCGVA